MEEKKTKLVWTTSKILSFLIFTAGVILSLVFSDKEPFLVAIMYATINQSVKNMPEIVKKLKESVK